MGGRARSPGAGDRVADEERRAGRGEVNGLKMTTAPCLRAVSFDVSEGK